MQFLNPTFSGTTPEYDFVTEENKIPHWHDYEIELPTDGWCFLKFDAVNPEDKNGVLIGYRNQFWTETFYVIRYDLKQDDVLAKAALESRKKDADLIAFNRKYRYDKLFAPENEKLFDKGSFTIEGKPFDFMLTGGEVGDSIRRRFFFMYYPEGSWLGASFYVEHLVEMNKSIKIDIIEDDNFTFKAISIILTLRRISLLK